MGTNYFHRTNICECCGRYDERHICKSLRIFQGYNPTPWPDGDQTSIRSWADWKQLIQSGGEVWDEYDTLVDTGEFIRDVEATNVKDRARQYRWMLEHAATDRWISMANDWLDPENFSFTSQEFS